MGVWPTAPASVAFNRKPAQVRAWKSLLPDVSLKDIQGSPYAIDRYSVAPSLGGEHALASFRARLHARGIRLILDFIPNHTGLDHPWISQHPDFYVHAARRRAGCFPAQTSRGKLWIAHGKDPYFPPWADTAQLDIRNPQTREAMRRELLRVADLCDGVRCDMAMLVLTDVFARNWAHFPTNHPSPEREFWSEAIDAVKARYPNFLFLAEAYWDLEPRLLDLGFDVAYDKTWTDRLMDRNYTGIRDLLLSRPRTFLERVAHFLENHDEPRVASRLSWPEHRAAMTLLAALPGMCLLHDGQMEGSTARECIHLSRRMPNPPSPQITEFYERLLRQTTNLPGFRRGEWTILEPCSRSAADAAHEGIFGIVWREQSGPSTLTVVNLTPNSRRVIFPIGEPGSEGRPLLNPGSPLRAGDSGFEIEMPPYFSEILVLDQLGR